MFICHAIFSVYSLLAEMYISEEIEAAFIEMIGNYAFTKMIGNYAFTEMIGKNVF